MQSTPLTHSQKLISHTNDSVHIVVDRRLVEHGKGTLVFLHGLGSDSSSWDEIRQQPQLAQYHSFALDLRGHGHSSRPEEPEAYRLDELAKDVICLVSHLQHLQGPLILVGHCLGGIVALQVASQTPVDSLIVINTSVRPVSSWFPFSRRILQVFFRWLAWVSPRWHVTTYPDYSKFRHTSDFDLGRILSDMSHTSVKSYFSLLSVIVQLDLHQLFSIIPPTLILHGENDRVFGLQHARKLHEQLNGSRLKLIPGGNHIMIWDHSEKLASEISTFLE